MLEGDSTILLEKTEKEIGKKRSLQFLQFAFQGLNVTIAQAVTQTSHHKIRLIHLLI